MKRFLRLLLPAGLLLLVTGTISAACGGDDDDGDGAFELPQPGEYSFEVTGTMEIEFLEEAVSAAPRAQGGPETVRVEGSIKFKLEEDGTFTIGKDGVLLLAGTVVDGDALPIRFTLNDDADEESGGVFEPDGHWSAILYLQAQFPTGETTTSEEPIRLESDDNPLTDEGANLTTPPDAEPVRFMRVEGYGALLGFFSTLFEVSNVLQHEPPTATPTPIATPTPTPTQTVTPEPTPIAADVLPQFAVVYTIDSRPYDQVQFQFAEGHDGCGLEHVHSNVTVYPFQEWIVRGGDGELRTSGDAPLVDQEHSGCGFGTRVSLGPFSVFVPVPHFAATCDRIEIFDIEPASDLEERNLSEFIDLCDMLRN